MATIKVQGKKFSCIFCIQQLHSCSSACLPRSVSRRKTGSTGSLDLAGWALKPWPQHTTRVCTTGAGAITAPPGHSGLKETNWFNCVATPAALCIASTRSPFSLLHEKASFLWFVFSDTWLRLHLNLTACFRPQCYKKLNKARSAAQQWDKIIRTIKSLAYLF